MERSHKATSPTRADRLAVWLGRRVDLVVLGLRRWLARQQRGPRHPGV